MKTKNENKKRIDQILNEHKAAIQSQIKKGFNRGIVLKHFRWENTKEGIKIELLD